MSVAFVIYRAITYKKHRIVFPELDGSQMLFQEKGVSGHSLKNALTRLAGARNCLRLTITTDELWTTLEFPFSLLFSLCGDFYDVVHRIKKQDILSVREAKGVLKRKSFIVVYQRGNGKEAQLELEPRRCEEFQAALAVGMSID